MKKPAKIAIIVAVAAVVVIALGFLLSLSGG